MEIRETGQIEIRSEVDSSNDDGFERITAIISSGAIDGHGTYMTEKTLNNFVRALNEDSIQLKDSHKQTQGFGVSERGELKDGKVIATFKVLKGLALSDSSYPTSDDFLKAVKAGLITKTSVGFSGGRWLCNICPDETDALRSASCNHFPKYEYEVKVDGKREKKECNYGIDDSRLVETSLVGAGSNQDAVIIEKAQRCFELGTLPADIKSELETVHGVRFEGSPDNINKNNGGSSVDTEKLEKQVEELTKERDEALRQVEELTDLANCGKAARTHMTGEARDDFKVARGEKVTEKEIERFNKRAEKMTFEDLVLERDHQRTMAPEKPEIDPGSKTTQPDNSGKTDEGDDNKTKKVRGINPPSWAGRYGMEA